MCRNLPDRDGIFTSTTDPFADFKNAKFRDGFDVDLHENWDLAGPDGAPLAVGVSVDVPGVRERLLEQHTLPARHFALHSRGGRLLRAEPDQVQSVLPGAAVTGHRHDVGEGHRVLARVVVGSDARRGEVLGDREGLEEAGTRGRATGPRSFSRWRSSASRTRSWCRTRPDTRVRLTVPSGPMRSSRPMLVTSPLSSTRTGTASTYRIGMRALAVSSSSLLSQPCAVSVVSDIA